MRFFALRKSCGICLSLLTVGLGIAIPVTAQQSAALVGIANSPRLRAPFNSEQAQLGIQYSTVLLVRDGQKVTIAATLPDIVVPRNDGFWRVGVHSDCQIQSMPEVAGDGERKVEEWDEQLYVSRIGEAPQIAASRFGAPQDRCPAQVMEDFKKGQDSRAGSPPPPYADFEPFDPCIYTSEVIRAVTPNFTSTREHAGNSAGCETRGFSWNDAASVTRIEDGTRERYSVLVGDEGWAEYNRVLMESAKGLEDAGFNCGLSEESLDMIDRLQERETGWYLAHEKGKWTAAAVYQPGNAACQFGGDLSLPLPRDVVGSGTLRPAWGTLAHQLPELKDAFSSPAGDLVVAFTGTQVEVYLVQGQRVGKRLLTVPADRLVMVQWATGKYVDAWKSTLQEWQRKGLPPSVLRKQKDSN